MGGGSLDMPYQYGGYSRDFVDSLSSYHASLVSLMYTLPSFARDMMENAIPLRP